MNKCFFCKEEAKAFFFGREVCHKHYRILRHLNYDRDISRVLEKLKGTENYRAERRLSRDANK